MIAKIYKIKDLPFLKATLLLALMVGFSLFLIALRIVKTDKVTYYFLTFNMFLALVPLAFAYLLRLFFFDHLHRPLALILLATWLIFLPNAPYIVTDFVHLRPRHGIPIWFDIILVFGFASAGMLSGFISLRIVQLMVKFQFGTVASWLTVIVSLFASGYAIYLGRFLRLNSWNILTQPLSILSLVLDHALNPIEHYYVFAVTAIMFTFMFAFYLVLVNFKEGQV